jgi:hypothetical protein
MVARPPGRWPDVAGMRTIVATGQPMVRSDGGTTICGASATFRRMWRLAGFDRVDSAIVME